MLRLGRPKGVGLWLAMKKKVAIGFLGTTKDAGKGPERWKKWRPTVSTCSHVDLPIDRLVLLRDSVRNSLTKRIKEDIAQVSPDTEVEEYIIDFKDPWDFEEVYGKVFDFAKAYKFDRENEEYLINITTGTHVAQICMYLLTEANYLPGKLLQVSPPKTWGSEEPGDFHIIDLDLSRYDKLATRFVNDQQEATSFLKSGIDTKNKDFNRMIDQIEKVAIRSKAPLLLMGPTGAGKSHLAKRVFELKKHRHQVDGDFVEVNCATLRGDSAMSALFGHVKGAFTGAQTDRKGLLRLADKGMLFLDEIGELGLDEQAMILRAIEEGLFLPVGSDKDVSSEFQLIAGTNRDLAKDVRSGRFREDLLARLNLWTFHLPGLKDRREDIEPNLDFELDKYGRDMGENIVMNVEARRMYVSFATSEEAYWSANFRDLGASVTRMAVFATGGRINQDIVTEEVERLRGYWREEGADGNTDLLMEVLGDRYEEIDLFDRAQLADVIRVCRDSRNLSSAGRKLFAVSRMAKKTSNDADRLRKYLRRFDLDWETVVE